MPDARAIIRISALPDSALRRALSGTVDAARKANRSVASEQVRTAKEAERAQAKAARMAERASQQAAREAIRNARRVESETKRSTERMLRDADRAATRERREAEKTARAKIQAAQRASAVEQREAEQSARARVRAAERAAAAERREYQKTARTQIREAERGLRAQTKAMQQASEKRRALGMALAGGAYGAAKGGAALASRGQGLAGVGSLEERVSNAGDFRAQLIRTAGEAKLTTKEREQVETNLLKVSEQTNVSIMDLVAGLRTAQQDFSKFREFSAIIGDLAKVSQATGEPLEDMIGAIGTMSEAYSLDEAGQRELVNAMLAMAERGAISPGDFARSMASKAGTFQMATGRKGIEGAREFMATAQNLGTSQAGAAKSATMLEQFASRIALPDVQGKLAQIGVRTTDKEGRLLSVGDIGRQLTENPHFQRAGVRQAILPDLEARNAATFIMAELSRNPAAFTELQGINAAEGEASVNKRFAELSADPLFKLRNVGVRAQTETVRDADRIVQAITPAVTELTALQTKFPLLSESLDTLETAVRWAVGTLLADRFIRGAGSFGTTAGEALGKTASVSIGQSFGSSSTLGKVGMLGQVMGTGLAAYFATHEFLKMTGIDKSIEKLGETIYNKLHPQASPSFSSGSIVHDASLTTGAQDAAAAKQAAEDALSNFLSPGGQGGATLPSPLIPPANAELKITIKGPGEVTSVRTDGLHIETTADNGRRDIFPAMTTKYLKASFRGAAFLVEATTDEAGPRHIIHEFPGRQYAYAEPSGAFPARFTVEAHLIGPDFEAQLVALEEALDQPGAGKLVHPHRGDKFCAVDGPYRIQRHTRELGIVRVSITFCEAGPPSEPRVTVDTSSDVRSKIEVAYLHIGERTFSVEGPDFLTRTARAILAGPKGVTNTLAKVNNRIHSAFGTIDDVSRAVVDFGNEVSALLGAPADLALRLQGLVNSVLSAATAAGFDLNRGDKLRNRARVSAVMSYTSALGTFGDTLAPVPTTTSTRQQQADTQAALVDLIETAGLLGAVGVLVDIPLDNTDQAGDAFNVIRDLFDRIDDRGTLDDAASQAMADVRASFHRHLRDTVTELPQLGRYTPPVTVPALVLAHRLYGDSTRDEEIVERNPHVEHPGFIPGGVELQVAEVQRVATEPEVSLVVNGSIHEGWTQVTVRSSIEELALSFSVQYSQRWSNSGEPVAISPGDAVQVRIGDTLAITGYVDDASEDYDASSHTVSVAGRSKTADLVDCAAVHQGGSIRGKDLRQLAELLCEPFGITVSLGEPDLDVGDASNVQIQDGETVFETLSNVARQEGVLLLSDPAGNLVLSRASSEPKASLELRTGESIKRGSLQSSHRDRFSTYLLKGQAPGSATLKGLGAASMKHETTDAEVKRYRPTVIVDSNTTLARMQQRAAWERNTRAGRALALTYDVQGWTNIYGLWQPNTLLRVVDTFLGIDAELLVTTVDLQRSLDGGRTARLEVQPRETFDVLKPPRPPKRQKRGRLAALGL